jgi:hypothetical protein
MTRVAATVVALAALLSVLSPATARAHCQVPCGIYDDEARIAAYQEDVRTIEKAMRNIEEISAKSDPTAEDLNQLGRWISTKEAHAQSIQDLTLNYWLAQRIKAPTGDDVHALDDYHRKLALLHQIVVAAMKCKQTVDLAHPQTVRSLVDEFWRVYHGHSH